MKSIEAIGRITKIDGSTGEAEFTQEARKGDFLYYNTKKGKVIVQITRLRSTTLQGFHGKFEILEPNARLPKLWDYLYEYIEESETGYLNIGVTIKGQPFKLRLNPFFLHTLIGGMNRRGKTHLQIILAEEFVKYKIPAIIFDTQGELVNVQGAEVVEDVTFEDVLGILRQKKVLIYNLQGRSYQAKTERCYEILSQLMEEKERDYKRAEGNLKLMQLPPVIVDIDETEIYAPTKNEQCHNRKCRSIIIEIAKRGGKMGIGLINCSQRLPGLHYEVRSQCHNAIIFQIIDAGSHTVLSKYPYIGSYELTIIKGLKLGQCLIVGEITTPPKVVLTRDITTKRAKNLDFEQLLGLSGKVNNGKPKIQIPEILREIENKKQKKPKILKPLITFEELQKRFPIRELPIHGKCIVIPETRFKQKWRHPLVEQGYAVILMADMPGGSSFIIRKRTNKENLEHIKQTANQYLPRRDNAKHY